MIADTCPEDADRDLIALRAGQMVGRYRVAAVLGRGGFGITYRAVDAELGREVALKEYLPAALAVRQDGVTVVPRSTNAAQDYVWGRERFVAEGRTLAALHRVPGVVLVHDFIETHGTAYLVMELLGGQTVQDRVNGNGALDGVAFERLLPPLLDGLQRVHEAGFLHRDIKPANILLDQHGQPTLIDFGASRAAVAGRTQAMTAVFTPGYAAIEQFTAAAQGPWTDVYGLAATLHFAITGRPPPNAVDRVLDDTCTPLSQISSPIAAATRAAIDAGLAVRAKDRPQSIAAWRPMFASAPAPSVVTDQPSSAQATVVMRQPIAAKSGRTRRPVLIAGIALSIAVVAATAWFLVGQRAAPPAPTIAHRATAARADKMQQELEASRRAQQAAVEDANRLRAEAEARRKADEEAALRLKIEDELRQKAEAEQVARQKAEEEQRLAAAEAAKAEAEKAEAAKAEAAKAKADHGRSEDRKKAPPQGLASSAATGAGQCDGNWRSQWCRGAFQGFPPSCWHVPMTIRNGAISGQWTSPRATEAQTFSGRVAPDGTVNIVYNGIGQQTYTGSHFTVTLTGSVADGVLNAKGHPGSNGREFSVTVQCR
jgi:hypothetical protein